MSYKSVYEKQDNNGVYYIYIFTIANKTSRICDILN